MTLYYEGILACVECQSLFGSWFALADHMVSSHYWRNGWDGYPICALCDVGFSTIGELAAHLEQMQGGAHNEEEAGLLHQMRRMSG